MFFKAISTKKNLLNKNNKIRNETRTVFDRFSQKSVAHWRNFLKIENVFDEENPLETNGAKRRRTLSIHHTPTLTQRSSFIIFGTVVGVFTKVGAGQMDCRIFLIHIFLLVVSLMNFVFVTNVCYFIYYWWCCLIDVWLFLFYEKILRGDNTC